MKRLIITAVFALTFIYLHAQMDWRYDRTGIYQNETGLMTVWPEEGPVMLWYYDGLGEGHSSVAISNDKVYITGMLEDKGYLYVFDFRGKLLHKLMYSDEWTENYVGSRATPIISNGKIYLMSGMGDLICLDENNLKTLWQRNLFIDFDSKNIPWGFNESPLLIGNMIIATPGGKEHNVVALNKHTGELIWSSPCKGDLSSYCSPLYISNQETPLIVTMTAEHIVGLEASSGKMLWSFVSKNRNAIHSNTPIYANNRILCSNVDIGSTMIQLSEGGRKAEIVWEVPELDNMMGAMVKVGNFIYGSGSGYKERVWYCANWQTGEIKYKSKDLAVGALIFADNKFYCYSDKGEMALVKATPEKFEVVSKFMITKGTEQHWAHPVINKGILYVRHGDSLMAFKIIEN